MNKLNKRLLYIPSIDTGPVSSVIRKGENYRGRDFRWYIDDVPEKYRLKSFLISAGHKYKKLEYTKDFGFPDDMVVFGDSGGFQIATGVLPWSEDLRHKIFQWLELNSTVAANLDLPPRTKMAGKFQECMDISYDNFKYFNEHQSGSTKYLACLQGTQLEKYKIWYDKVKGFDFKGWAIGQPKGSYGILASLAVLMDGKEHLSPNTEYIHFLGITSIEEIIILSYVQKKFNEMGFDVQLTTDSSTPGLASKYGLYYTGFDLKREAFKTIHVPRKSDNDIYSSGWKMPNLNAWDEYFFGDQWLDVDRFNSLDYAAFAVHNLSILTDAFTLIQDFINTDKYFFPELFDRNTCKVLDSVDNILESSKPMETFKMYVPLYKGAKKQHSVIDHQFFAVND